MEILRLISPDLEKKATKIYPYTKSEFVANVIF